MIACPICHIEYDDARLRYCSRCGSDIATRASAEGADAWIGKVIDGRYRVQARIGTGGMGAVYRVEHVRMGKVAAMKVLHRELATDEQVVKRFRREVEAVSRLNHQNIVQTFDFGYWGGLLYLIMEYVRGEDLGAITKREGPLPVDRSWRLALQVCSALDEAHHAGVVHRDLKPENMVCVRRRSEEHVKVLDFGLAKLRERPELGEITGAGHLVGTPYYMSPEQVRSENVDHRTDIYSLGATLYRVITGVFPFEGNSPMGIMSKHLTDPLIPPSLRVPALQLPPEVDRVVMRAMAKVREDRYGSAGQMRADIEELIGYASGDRPGRMSEGMAGASPIPAVMTAPPRLAMAPVRARVGGRGPTPAPLPVPMAVAAGGDVADDDDVRGGAAAFDVAAERARLGAASAGGGRVIAVDDVTSEGSEVIQRMQREDFDEFERQRRARRLMMAFVVTPILLAGLGLAGWSVFRSLRPRPVTSEHEPNDTAAMASLLPHNRPVSGIIGDARPGGEPDFDYYRIPAGKGPRAVTARITAVPDIDLVLELFDDHGQPLAKSDGAGKGEGEMLGPVGVAMGEAYVRARQVWTMGEPAGPGAPNHPYELTVDWTARRPEWELEPNDSMDHANKIDREGAVSGYLTSPEDVDWYEVVVPAGSRVDADVEGIDGIDVVVLVDSDKKRIDGAGIGDDEEVTARAGDDGKVLLGIAEQPHKKTSKRTRPERDEPYTLKVKFHEEDRR